MILDDKSNELEANGVSGLLAIKTPWPSIARTIYGDHERYMQTYLSPFKDTILQETDVVVMRMDIIGLQVIGLRSTSLLIIFCAEAEKLCRSR